jgi:eukaryotic-like serine/threonine-protein kinase
MTNFGTTDQKTFGDRYEIQSKIARGGMADVYLAQDKLLDRPVALKVLFAELSVDPSFVERFRREAQNAAKLSHPNIVSVYDWGEDASTYYIVMEYIDGRSLSTILREDGPMAAGNAAKIGADVAAALSFAHRNGVIHRDVKPGNVLIDRNGLVKVTDFGIARARNTTENLTQTGAVMGTATYFSPEQAQGITVDERSDVYSLGVVMYECVAGKPPFQGDNAVTIAYKHVRETPAPLREVNSKIPIEFATIVSKAMAKSPAARYANADEMQADLQRFNQGQPITTRPPLDATQAIPYRNAASAYADSTRTIPAINPQRDVSHPKPPKDKSVTGPLMLLVALVAAIAVGLLLLFHTSGGSDSNKPVTIPNVVGQDKDAATAALKLLKLQVTYNNQPSSQPSNQVLAQNPTAGTNGHQNDTVQLTISSGPAAISLDDFTGQSADAAKSALQQLGLTVQETQQSSDSVAENTVISQSPSANTQVQAGSTVTLTVSSGPSQVQVPNVVGFTITAAAQQLSAAGLRTVEPSGVDPDSNLVASTDPPAGTSVAKGSAVTLAAQTTTTTSTSTSTTSTTEKPGH